MVPLDRTAKRPKEQTMKFEELTPEQQEKARACKTPEEIIELAKSEGYELSEEELDDVAGGWCCDLICAPDWYGAK